MTTAKTSDYWFSPSALFIQLNAVGDRNYIHANTSFGTMVMCYMRDIEGLGYDNGHNYRRWPLIASPTVFHDNEKRYVYIAIPKSTDANAVAQVVYPSVEIDIYGCDAEENQIGPTDYYYIFTQGIISASVVDGVMQDRVWEQEINAGRLATDEAISGATTDFWIYDETTDRIIFLKEVEKMTVEHLTTMFAVVKQLELNGTVINGIAGENTPTNSTDTLVTPDWASSHYISKIEPDIANGKITFRDGADFGVFTSGLTGTGGMVDAKGNAELNSLYVRQFISAPKFVFNQVNVTNAEQWNTNGYGTIESVDLARKRITLRLEENEYGSVCIGDICRGIFADIGNVYGSDSNVEGDLDDCNFVLHRGFFTAYFYVRSVIENSKGRCVFEYGKKSPDCPDPCAFMDFAQYGSFNDESRQSSIYFSSRGRSYIEVLDGVKTWEIQHANRVCRYGWLGNLTVEYKDGRKVQLKGNGLFAQNNIYFGGNIEWLHGLKEVEDLKELATAYDVSLSQYQSVVTVDDMGNVINGLYTEDEAKTTKQYRISTAVFVRKGTQILLEEEPKNEDVTEGHYRLHTISDDCSTMVENSTVFVTGIRNIKDGVADTEDDATFDYDEMRKMSDAYIQVVVDLEGKTTKTVAMPIRIQHDSLPFMVCDLINPAAQVSWNTKAGKYIGLPIQSTVNLFYHNEPWEISECKVVGGLPSVLTATITRNANGKSYDISINGTFAADTLPQVSNVQITVIGRYAGANYEYTKVLTIAKSADVVTYDVVPSADSIVVDKFDSMSASLVYCDVYCNSSDDKRYKLTSLPDGYSLKYGIDTDTPTIAIAPGTAISVTASNKKVVFALYDNNGTICDTEDVPVLAWGKDGKGIEYIFYLRKSEEAPSNPTPSDWRTNSAYQSQTTEYVPTWLGWTDDPSGVSAAFQYEYVAIRTSINGVWQPFSDPALHDHYGKHAPRATVTDNIITIPTDSKGVALIAFEERINFSLLVDARACTISSITKSGSLTNVSCSISSSGGSATISCSSGAALGNNAQTLNFTVVGTLDGASYQDIVTVKIVPNVTGEDGDGYEYVYYLCDEKSAPTSAPVRSSGMLTTGWDDDVPTFTDEKRYIYVAWRTGLPGEDGTFNGPKLFLYKAKDGVGEVSAYQMVDTMPTLKPTTVDYDTFKAAADTASLGNGWTKQIVKQGAKMVLGGSVSGVSMSNSAWTSYTDGGYTWWKSAAISNSETTSMRISFTTSEDNMRVTFYLKAYSESYDKIALSTLDSSTINSNTAIGGNGVSSGAIYFDVEKAGTHYVTVQYSKDSSVSSYLDCGLVRMATNECYVLRYPPIYRCHGTVEEKVITWGDITKETGDQGDKGDKGDKGDQGDQGDRGYNGCIFRTSEWKPNTEYRNDSEAENDGIKYIDIVYIENDDATYGWDIYQCETTHTSGSYFSSTYWQKFSNLTPIYTPLIVAKGAVFKFAQGQQFNIMEGNTIWGSFRHVPNSTDYAFWIGGSMGSAAPFAVTKGGKLKATEAVITGTINATSGSITGDIKVDGSLIVGNNISNIHIKSSTSLGGEIVGEYNGTEYINIGYFSGSTSNVSPHVRLTGNSGDMVLKPASFTASHGDSSNSFYVTLGCGKENGVEQGYLTFLQDSYYSFKIGIKNGILDICMKSVSMLPTTANASDYPVGQIMRDKNNGNIVVNM